MKPWEYEWDWASGVVLTCWFGETHISEGHKTSPVLWDTDGILPTPGLESCMWAGTKAFRTECHLPSTAPREQGGSRGPSPRAITPLPPQVPHHVSGYFPRVALPSPNTAKSFRALCSPMTRDSSNPCRLLPYSMCWCYSPLSWS